VTYTYAVSDMTRMQSSQATSETTILLFISNSQLECTTEVSRQNLTYTVTPARYCIEMKYVNIAKLQQCQSASQPAGLCICHCINQLGKVMASFYNNCAGYSCKSSDVYSR
jgi:hypothetical protein